MSDHHATDPFTEELAAAKTELDLRIAITRCVSAVEESLGPEPGNHAPDILESVVVETLELHRVLGPSSVSYEIKVA
ncbi:hypothetical protein LCGC14_2830310 [marine sediment metagenome]|uniref:Uncharacterized protein n=1 Tax=marine sediment metagenome TaxID=412755 RepID=A0A0F8YE92_9ZZZZ